ncbi:hypothetical protein EDB81DRAFT_378598 [Dactylonectria macrodidyma]|uniref:Uncharacterized protein n=1 Tax=Dactylonectria macrodidyma TaxID=307937 RepID=A0A9P9J8B0_9HYPO|nr:hypothetical protein EDB81DRAFT_378598 [Dactylonectria macrodidyma]
MAVLCPLVRGSAASNLSPPSILKLVRSRSWWRCQRAHDKADLACCSPSIPLLSIILAMGGWCGRGRLAARVAALRRRRGCLFSSLPTPLAGPCNYSYLVVWKWTASCAGPQLQGPSTKDDQSASSSTTHPRPPPPALPRNSFIASSLCSCFPFCPGGQLTLPYFPLLRARHQKNSLVDFCRFGAELPGSLDLPHSPSRLDFTYRIPNPSSPHHQVTNQRPEQPR